MSEGFHALFRNVLENPHDVVHGVENSVDDVRETLADVGISAQLANTMAQLAIDGLRVCGNWSQVFDGSHKKEEAFDTLFGKLQAHRGVNDLIDKLEARVNESPELSALADEGDRDSFLKLVSYTTSLIKPDGLAIPENAFDEFMSDLCEHPVEVPSPCEYMKSVVDDMAQVIDKFEALRSSSRWNQELETSFEQIVKKYQDLECDPDEWNELKNLVEASHKE
jgi:cell fate (sporulation/competence/biofilm development) regulator YmcA (YheA/YmcA/DUF963 family)